MADKPNFQVTCHTKNDADIHTRILGLGGTGGGGWWHPLDYLIAGIEGGAYNLWTLAPNGKSVWVIVASRNGRRYLKTEADGLEPDNLLALRHCQ